MPLPPADTRPLFRPLTADIIGLLHTLTPEDWQRPTLAGTWRVRDVVAHLIDTALRRLSAARDGAELSTPDRPITNEAELVLFINELNASWVRATRALRYSRPGRSVRARRERTVALFRARRA